MAGLAGTWSNIEVRSVIIFLQLKGTSPSEIHRQLVEVYGANVTSRHGNTFGFGALPLITAANRTRELLRRYNWEVLNHPPYSPDLAPSDFHLFGPSKKHLGGRRFATDGEVQQAVMSWLQALETDFFYAGTNASASMGIMWKNNLYQGRTIDYTCIYYFNKFTQGEGLLPYLLNRRHTLGM
jgi:hypothetical protein